MPDVNQSVDMHRAREVLQRTPSTVTAMLDGISAPWYDVALLERSVAELSKDPDPTNARTADPRRAR